MKKPVEKKYENFLEYKGSGMSDFVVNDKSELTISIMAKLNDALEMQVVNSIYLGKEVVSYPFLFCSVLKEELNLENPINWILVARIYENYLLEILGLIYPDGMLDRESFPLGQGIYQYEYEKLLIAYPKNAFSKHLPVNKELKELVEKSNGFLFMDFQELEKTLGRKSPRRKMGRFYQEVYPAIEENILWCGFCNWLKGHDFFLEDGKEVVSPSHFDEVA